VVASEVRTLAQRSAQAAREIKELIAGSVSRIQQGAELAERAAATMNEVNEAVGRVTVITGEISEANRAQSDGVSRLAGSMRTLDAGTQQNAAMVQQISASSENLRILAAELFELVSAFRLDARLLPQPDDGPEASTAAAPHPAV
jgi:methyl-accepting chemotaxis protein